MLLRPVYKSARADICTTELGVACHNKSTMESVGPLCTIMGMVPVRANLTICVQLAKAATISCFCHYLCNEQYAALLVGATNIHTYVYIHMCS